MMSFCAAAKRLLALTAASSVATLTLWLVAPSSTETAIANGDTRTIHFYHTHTGESIDATFRVDGHYDPAVLKQLNHFLRDWRNNDETNMDPRLFDTLWEVYRTAGAGDTPIQIYSAYRSPETNAMLRRRSRAVAEHSQHMLGKAMDTTMPGMAMERIREIGMKLQRGGVGWYPSANFVHLDVGGVRSWPRMSYDQLARLFPDGKTVHIPSNGQPMARYEEARAEIAARGNVEVPPAQQSQNFFAWLFGGGNNAQPSAGGSAPSVYANNTEGDDEAGVARGRVAPQARQMVAQAQPQPQPQPQPQQAQAPVPQQPAVVAQAEVAQQYDEPPLPLPPRRPTTLLALADDLPLPPVREKAAAGGFQLASVENDPIPAPPSRPAVVPDAIGGMISMSNAQPAPAPRRTAALPDIITQGTSSRELPTPALAFAAPESVSNMRAVDPQPVAAHVSPKTIGLRGAALNHGEVQSVRKASAAVTRVAPVTAMPSATALAGPAILGLRRAAQNPATASAL